MPPSAQTAPLVARLLELLGKRLTVVDRGLTELGVHIRAGHWQAVEDVRQKLGEDLAMLLRRLEKEAVPPTAAKLPKALLVDDNAKERQLLARFLRSAGVEVDTASDGRDALDYLHDCGKPDVLLLDMAMPRCDGRTMLQSVRHNPAYEGLRVFPSPDTCPANSAPPARAWTAGFRSRSTRRSCCVSYAASCRWPRARDNYRAVGAAVPCGVRPAGVTRPLLCGHARTGLVTIRAERVRAFKAATRPVEAPSASLSEPSNDEDL